MAGILITIGKDAAPIHSACCDVFKSVKDRMSLSLTQDEDNCHISKFTRVNETDSNLLIGPELSIFVIGTLIYKGQLGRSALVSLKNDLDMYRIDDLIEHCDGPFCLILRYTSQKGLWVVTDHAGIMNIYKYINTGDLALSTSSLVLSRSYPVTPNHEGIVQFLRNASVWDSHTIYNEIELLQPASIYWIEYSPLITIRLYNTYWKSPTEIEHQDLIDACDKVTTCLNESLSIFSREKVVCDLTAGYDSRLIVAILSQVMRPDEINTFVFGPDGSREVELVKGYCSNLGFMNHHLTLPPNWSERLEHYIQKSFSVTDGEESVFIYAPILWAQEFKAENYDYSLNGLGGELYRDFWWIQEIFARHKPANIEKLISTRVLQYEYYNPVYSREWTKNIQDIENIIYKRYINAIMDMDLQNTYNSLQIDNIYLRQKIRRWAGRTISSSNQFIPTVSPLTFKKCLETAMMVSPKIKTNSKLVKAMVERTNPVLARQKMLNNTPCQNIRFSNFYKFIPILTDLSKKVFRKISQKALNKTSLLDKSLTYQQSDFLTHLLSQNRFRERFNYDSLYTGFLYDKDKYDKFLEEALKGKFLYHNQLGNMITLEMRMREDKVIGNL